MLSAHEIDGFPGVRVVERAGLDHAIMRARFEGHVRHIAFEDVVARVAAVVIDVRPGGTELGARIRSWVRAL